MLLTNEPDDRITSETTHTAVISMTAAGAHFLSPPTTRVEGDREQGVPQVPASQLDANISFKCLTNWFGW